MVLDDHQYDGHHYTDQQGTEIAYSLPSRVMVAGNTMYIAGTSFASDVADWPKIPRGQIRNSNRWHTATSILDKHPEVTRLVGHSLGATVAEALAADRGLQRDLYNNPKVSWKADKHSHRHYFDPISMFDRGSQSNMPSSWNPHAYDGHR